MNKEQFVAIGIETFNQGLKIGKEEMLNTILDYIEGSETLVKADMIAMIKKLREGL